MHCCHSHSTSCTSHPCLAHTWWQAWVLAVCTELSGCSRDGFCRMGGNSFTVSNYTHMVWLWIKSLLKLWVNPLSAAPCICGEVLIHCTLNVVTAGEASASPHTHTPTQITLRLHNKLSQSLEWSEPRWPLQPRFCLLHTHTGIQALITVVDDHEQGVGRLPGFMLLLISGCSIFYLTSLFMCLQALFTVRGPGCALEAGLLISSQACSPRSLLRLSLLSVVRLFISTTSLWGEISSPQRKRELEAQNPWVQKEPWGVSAHAEATKPSFPPHLQQQMKDAVLCAVVPLCGCGGGW